MIQKPNDILREGSKLTFSDIFNLPYAVHEIVAEYGYTLSVETLLLPRTQIHDDRLSHFKAEFYANIPYVSLTSEAAKREIFIAPIIWRLLRYVKFHLDIEYPLYVDDQLRGVLDYLLRSEITNDVIVIEAKKGELESGFSQLAVQMIALDKWLPTNDDPIYGAVSLGNIWLFGRLDRQTKQIAKDIDTYQVPADLEELLSILVGILS